MSKFILDSEDLAVIDNRIVNVIFTTSVSTNACLQMVEGCMDCDGSCAGDCGSSCVGGCQGNGTNGAGN